MTPRCPMPALGLLLPLLASCGDGPGVSEVPPPVASIQVTPEDGAVVPEGTITLTADIRDSEGRRLTDRIVTWTTTASGTVVSLRPGGVVAGVELGGPVTVRARVEGVSDSAAVSVVTSGSVLIDGMLRGIDEFVRVMVQNNTDLLPLNPHLSDAIARKITLLSRPGLSSSIVRGQYIESAATSGARDVPIAAVFAADTMRDRVGLAVGELQRALPALESFVGAPLPASHISIWYGFALGSRGGGGSLYMEDQGTYDATRTSAALPYLAIVDHELAHSWIGHESLTQFLELYLYNTTRTGSPDIAHWTHTRGYAPDRPDNTGVHAILDIYRILGLTPMSAAFHELHTIRPPYGLPLSDAARAAIIDRAPADRRADVAALVDRIGL